LPYEVLGGVKVHRVATSRFGRRRRLGRAVDYASFYVSCSLALLRLLRRGDLVIAKTDPPLICIFAAMIAKAKGAALVNWQQDVFPEVAIQLGLNPLPNWCNGLLRYGRDLALRFATVNVLIGERMSDYFAGRGIPLSKLRVIPNWADAAVIQPKPTSSSALRASLGLADRFIVCYSGNLGQAHEFETMLGAAVLLATDPVVIFVIIGGGAKMAALKQAVGRRDIDNFRFLPYQSRETLEDSLAAADVHLVSLLPALEGLIVPSKAYGVLAAGRPLVLIGDADGDTGRLVRGADCGCVVQVGDFAALADVLLQLKEDPERRAQMGVRGRQKLCETYGMRTAVDSWIAVMDSHA
jgi:colanic acid biosynthesis glycosyl transferase WcaI